MIKTKQEAIEDACYWASVIHPEHQTFEIILRKHGYKVIAIKVNKKAKG